MPSKAPYIRKLWETVPDRDKLSILDLSCGSADSTCALHDLGFGQITATNYEQTPPARLPEGATFVGGVDLNERYPFDDDSFDCVHLQEVFEHLENPAHTVRELARVVKPGGHVVITTPNILNMHSRVHFLTSGFFEGRRHPISYAKAPGDAGNVYITNLPELHYLMAHSGLSIDQLTYSRWKWRALLFLIPLYPFVLFGTWLATRRPRRANMFDRSVIATVPPEKVDALLEKQKGVFRRVRSLMLRPEVLLSRNLMFRARKTDGDPFDA